jgi:hypothetical protein
LSSSPAARLWLQRLGLGRLPGDKSRENFTFYLPIRLIVVSVVLSLILG